MSTKMNQGRQVCVEAIEPRMMLAAEITRFLSPSDQLVSGSSANIFNTTTPENVKAQNAVVILMGEDESATLYGSEAGPHGRSGIFKLPTVRADGSVDIAGTAETDVITAERVTGVQETYEHRFHSTDDEADFISVIGADGERFLTGLNGDTLDVSIESVRRSIKDNREAYDSPGRLPEDTPDAHAYFDQQLAGYQKALTNLLAVKAAIANGDLIKYTLAGVYDFYVQTDPNAAAKATIRVDGGAGSDTVQVSSNVPLRTKLSGGSGADKLISGTRHADLFGGGGNDSIISRSTRGGTLDGGKGSDRYFNRAAGAGEMQVLGRNDGDRIISGAAAVPIKTAGLFGNSTIQRQAYFLLSYSDGQVDLLA